VTRGLTQDAWQSLTCVGEFRRFLAGREVLIIADRDNLLGI
jgi:hypothetical protein